ncbi:MULTISPECIES: SigE family RNA polymerase sigma factor [unclassified Nocardioides]|uniref:SigE family RNA polymerase sigma factor n=1 Tax=unclassified Nocardioides TaxID=2615069 RepID=UPI001F46E01A|nr:MULTISPECIES: SigE family RNA polymerase sigma factor [unclassified Nocardioides]
MTDPDFESWVTARGGGLLRFAYVLTGNAADAEDVVQDALSRAIGAWPRICAADDPDAYVRRMVVNAHTSWWRKFRRRESPVAEVRTDGSEVTGPPAYDDRLWQACRRLPEAQRTAIVLRFYEDMDYAAIAAITGVREGSVRSRVSRGLDALRAELGDHDHERGTADE